MSDMEEGLSRLSCFICHGREDLRDVHAKHDYQGRQEVYSQIIQDCFKIQLSSPSSHGLLSLCCVCVNLLRTSVHFRAQIQYATQRLPAMQDCVQNDDSSAISDWPESLDAEDNSMGIPIENETVRDIKKERNIKDSYNISSESSHGTSEKKHVCLRSICIDVPSKEPLLSHCIEKIYSHGKSSSSYNHSKGPEPAVDSIICGDGKIKKTSEQRASTLENDKITTVTANQKLCMLQMHQKGIPKSLICDKFRNIRRSTIYEVLSKEFIEKSPTTPQPALTTDRTTEVPLEQKLSIIKLFQAGTSKPSICEKYKSIRRSIIYEILMKERMEEILDGKGSNEKILRPSGTTQIDSNPSSFTKRKESIETDRKKMEFPPYNENRLETDCSICGEKFPHNFAMRRHIFTHFPNFVCESCGKAFAYEKQLNYHIVKHHSKPTTAKVFPCELCDKAFKSVAYRRTHVNIKHKGKRAMFSCSECGDSFTSAVIRSEHLSKVHGHVRPRYICDLCEASYFKPWLLRLHIDKTHNQKRDFECGECGKAFFDRHHLKRHSVVHLDVKNFPCEFCGKAFKCKKHLVQHFKTHINK